MPSRNFKIRLGPFWECHNVGVYCKQFALQVSTDETHKTQINTNLSRISSIYSNFSNIRSKEQLLLTIFSFDEEKTTSQIQE